ncbi:MAG: hypothetical protein JXM71_04155 [Spirochaetales bacterium]|nr:hypothetical protein [Spirochaetales bacterium]
MLTDAQGERLGLGRASVGLYRGEHGYESDPIEWLRACAGSVAEATAAAGLDAATLRTRLRAVAVSGNGPTLVTVGEDGLPLGRASSWMDRSATIEAAVVAAEAGRQVDPSFYLPKVLRALSVYGSAVRRFFSGPEYLAFMLGARAVSYLADSYYDSYIWDSRVSSRLGLDPALFPPYVAPAMLIGSVSDNASTATGLPAGLPIVSAFPDFLAALVGSGSVSPGIACDRSGTSEAINVCASRPFPDRDIFSLPHVIPGLWNLSGGLSTSGKALEWFSGVSGYSGIGSDSVFQEAERAEPGAGGVLFLPYLAGERAPLWNPSLRGAFIGLSLAHGRKEMARAVVESIAFGLRLATDRIADGGFAIDTVRCSGGAARDDALCSIKADVLGLELEVPRTPECETMGDACACAVALGDYTSIAEASAAMVRISTRVEPDAHASLVYTERYEAWKSALDAIIRLNETPH